MNILVLNAGSASLKFEVIAMLEAPSASHKQRKLVSGIVEGIGEEATFSLLENKQTIQQEKIAASDYGEATRRVLIFGGGIGEDTSFVRARVLEEPEWCGLMLDPVRNEQTINREGRITTDSSSLYAYVIPVEEGLLIADQTVKCLKAS